MLIWTSKPTPSIEKRKGYKILSKKIGYYGKNIDKKKREKLIIFMIYDIFLRFVDFQLTKFLYWFYIDWSKNNKIKKSMFNEVYKFSKIN